MAGLFDTLGTATRGLGIVQRGLATTGHNIANADTPGYTRQRSVLQAGRPQNTGEGAIGTGVEQVTVDRIIDRFIGFRLVTETSRKAALETESTIYREVETLVNEQLAGGLKTELTSFFDSLDDLSNSVQEGQPAERGQVLASAQSLVDTFHRYDTQLRSLQRDTDRGITGMLPEINDLTKEIARLNGEIAAADLLAPANDLRDQRDLLIQKLAEKIEITSVDDQDGMASVRITGGLSLVDKRIAGELVAVVNPAAPNAFDPTFSQVYYRGAGSYFDATSLVQGGELGGLIDARDNIIAGVVRDLDAVAFTLTDTFNTQHRTGLGLVDGAPHDFFADLGATQTTVDDSARNFALALDIDPQQGGTINNIAAGAGPDTTNGLPQAAMGDTRAIEALKDLRTLRIPNYLAGDAVGAPTGDSVSISGGLVNLIGDIGQKSLSASRSLEQQEAVLAAVQDRRDSISGVSIDEEVAELVKLQANFQANARVITTVNLLMQDLFDAL